MKILYTLWFSWLMISSTFELAFYSDSKIREEDSPVVRESTTDIQVRVGEKLYVFGKAQGTLDNVKIGMHLLNFAQNPVISGVKAEFHQVSWKKLKNGAIQIQSSYHPWPNTLTWLVMPDGKLKMEASASDPSKVDLANLGLGFDFPDDELREMELNNQHFTLSAPLTQKQHFKEVSLEFVYSKLKIHSELSDLALNTHFSLKEAQGPDLVISFPEEQAQPEPLSSPGFSFSIPEKRDSNNTINKMILWFDFQ